MACLRLAMYNNQVSPVADLGSARDTCTPGPKFLHFHSFREKLVKWYVGGLRGLALAIWKILDPPLVIIYLTVVLL